MATDFASDPSFQDIIKSEEYANLGPEKRKALLDVLQRMQPEQRQQLAQGLTKPTTIQDIPTLQEGAAKQYINQQKSIGAPAPITPMAQLKDAGPTLIGLGVGMGLPALLPQTAGPLLRLGTEMAGNVLGRKVSQAAGLEPGNPLSLDTTDAVNAAVPVVVRGAGAGFRLLTRPGQNALKTADEANAMAAGKYAAERQQYGQEKDAWINRNQAANQATDTNNQALADARAKAIQIHQDALQNVPQDAEAAVGRPDPRALYSQAKASRQGLPDIDTTTFTDTAAKLGVDLRKPAEGVQSPFKRITDALQEFGAPEAPTATTSPIADAYGRPITTMVGGSPGGVPLERVTATVQRLGKVIGDLRSSGGPELGAAKELYSSLQDTLQEAASANPKVKAALSDFLDAQAAQRKVWALDDYQALFDPRKGYGYKQGNPEVKTDTIRGAFDNLVENDPFFKGSFTPQELKTLQVSLDKLPQTPIPRAPTERTVSKITPGPGEPPTMPEAVEPKVPDLPSGPRTRFAAALGYATGATIGAAHGMSPWFSGIAGGAVGLSAVSAPQLISRYIMAGPGGEQLLRKFMAGKQSLSSQDLAYLEAMGRATGILK